VLKIDLHLHTSDDPRDRISYSSHDLIDRAAALGFKALAITLHDCQLTDPSTFAYARERGVQAASAVCSTSTPTSSMRWSGAISGRGGSISIRGRRDGPSRAARQSSAIPISTICGNSVAPVRWSMRYLILPRSVMPSATAAFGSSRNPSPSLSSWMCSAG